MGISNVLRSFVVLFTLLISINAQAQGGRGGSFQGNQGGQGGQGGRGGNREESYPPSNLTNGSESGIWEAKSMILTQGDKVEWKIKGVPGQTIMATVRSDVFDPALKILDSKNKVVAENDDQYDGNQSPFLVFQFPDDKEYKLTVQNYRSSGGGRFDIYTQTFMPVDLKISDETRKKISVKDEEGGRERRTYLHFKATEGKVYAIPQTVVISGNGTRRLSFQMIIGPTGIYKTDFYNYRPNGGEPMFEAKKTGDYYLAYNTPGQDGDLVARLDVIEVQKVNKVGDLKVDLAPYGQKILKYEVDKGDIIRSITKSTTSVSFEMEFTSNNDPNEKDRSSHRGDANDSVKKFQPRFTDGSEVYNLYTRKAEIVMILRENENKPSTVNLQNSADIPTWEDGKPALGKVGLGETQFFVISGKKGDIQRLKGSAEGFELFFSLVDMDGGITNFTDPYNHKPGTELRYNENRKYLVMVTSPQGGGSGTFAMNLDSAKPESISLANIITYTEGTSFGTYSLDVEKGVRYLLLMSDHSGITLIDDEGNSFGYGRQDYGGKIGFYFVPGKTGKLKIKVDGSAGSTRFRIDKLILQDLN